MKKKIALITGITGQDGSYLCELLLQKNYIVHGIIRRSSTLNTSRIDHIYQDPFQKNKNLILHYGDMTDGPGLYNVISDIKPDEIYNLAAQSHVAVSFNLPEYTTNVNALGTLRILEAVNSIKLKKTKIYQASTSELYGKTINRKQNEKTIFHPRSPYGVSKIFAYWISINYREAYNMFVSNGILFNHESPRRGETFVTRKITIGLSKISLGKSKQLYMGNLESKRDWGHAKDYAYMQWLILQQKKPDDYVISTGKQYSVRKFIELTCYELGFEIGWRNKGLKEVGYIKRINNNNKNLIKGKTIIRVSSKYYRPAEVDSLLGDSTKARRKLKWIPKTSIKMLVKEMVKEDLLKVKKELI
mgnify:CR=1 FL=1|jgi:GDPmannose 4,6-dehydratase